MINHEFPPIGGGGANASFLLARQFVKMGHQVYVITGHYRNLAKKEKLDGVQIHRIFTFRSSVFPWKLKSTQYHSSEISLLSFSCLSFRQILKTVKKFHPDILHGVFLIPSGLSTIVAGKLTRCPTVVTLAGADIYSPTRFRYQKRFLCPIYKYVLKSADAVTAPSSDIKKRAQEILDRSIHVFPWGVDTNRFHPSVKPMLEMEGPVILGVGRLVSRKRFSSLIHVFVKVKKHVENAQLVIVGDGPEAVGLKQLSHTLGVQESVHFAGSVSDKVLPCVYSMAKVVAIPSYHEGFSLVGLEAMASGKPVVATKVGGIPDWLTSGETGFTCSLNDFDLFADRLIVLLTDDFLCNKMGQQARKRAEHFNWENVAHYYLQIYRKAINQHHEKENTIP